MSKHPSPGGRKHPTTFISTLGAVHFTVKIDSWDTLAEARSDQSGAHAAEEVFTFKSRFLNHLWFIAVFQHELLQ